MFEVSLIEEIQKYPYIYDKFSNDYKDKTKKARAWANISQTLGKSESDCKSRWKSLRDRFVREYTRIHLAAEFGEDRKKSWYLYDSLLFLNDHIRPKQFTESLSFDNQNDRVVIKVHKNEQPVEKKEVKEEQYFAKESSPSSISLSSSSSDEMNLSSKLSASASSYQMKKRKLDTVDTGEDSVGVDKYLAKLLKKVERIIQNGSKRSDKVDHRPFFKLLEEKLDMLPKNEQDEIKMEFLNIAHQRVLSLRRDDV